MKKKFDCVEMKRHGAEAVRKQMQNLTREEQRAFWSERTEALRARQAERRDRQAQRSDREPR